MKAVGKVGLSLNIDKTIILTNEAQPPNTLVTREGLILKVLDRNQGQKWLGCILTACGSKMQDMDLAYHMEQGTKAMHANRWILQDKIISMYTRLSRVEPLRQKMAGPSGHRRETEKNCEQIAKYDMYKKIPLNAGRS